MEQFDLILRQAHMRAVNSLRFAAFIKPYENERNVCARCERDSATLLRGALAPAAAKPRFIADDVEFCLHQRVQRAIELGRDDQRTAGTLITRRLGKITDHGDARMRRKGKQPVFVFHKYGRSARGFPRSFVMFLFQFGFGRLRFALCLKD
ncbi:hypothetical protein SDC9_164310 [bioreactor metagenome]|uniref:Uncharacterized protein n=1 Tax=bioreactor metagenome TaxID=1076179 RepID=A0A645FRB4_9ZZZZ